MHALTLKNERRYRNTARIQVCLLVLRTLKVHSCHGWSRTIVKGFADPRLSVRPHDDRTKIGKYS